MRLRVKKVGTSRVDRVEGVTTLGQLRSSICGVIPNITGTKEIDLSLDKKVRDGLRPSGWWARLKTRL